ncbi:hypothetical protein PG996_006742 [Apiospora saccharicola]|uniref:Nephrocystin 3-like N-terminal domain-containing protein n=1 Tax=Apiospora saccharicola TaxID=335842 RepID=A0ABR1V8U9_9PEZI
MQGLMSLWKGKHPSGSSEGEPSGDVSPDENDRGPYMISPGGDANEGIDIVFVHGLRGSRLGTWSSPSGFCWPRDLLAQEDDFKTSRIIAWGYDSRVAEVTRYVSQEGLSSFAKDLLADLASLRVGVSRPIVFVAHSLGGLVVKDALIAADNYRSHGRFPDQAEIYSSTKGVIFFGTPHRGSDKVALGEMLASIAKISLRQPNTQLLDALPQDSHILEKQRRVHDQDQGHIVPAASAVYDGFSVQSASAEGNHMEMVKFNGRTTTYNRSLHYLRNCLEHCGDDRTNEERARLQTFPESLKFDTTEPSDRDADKSTGEWTFDDHIDNEDRNDAPSLTSWLESHDQRIFWISGKAGCGKSILMDCIFATLCSRYSQKETAVVLHSFSEPGTHLQTTQEGMLRNILHRLGECHHQLVLKSIPAREVTEPHTVQQLSNILQMALAAFEKANIRVVLLVDGLDEYRMPASPTDEVVSRADDDFATARRQSVCRESRAHHFQALLPRLPKLLDLDRKILRLASRCGGLLDIENSPIPSWWLLVESAYASYKIDIGRGFLWPTKSRAGLAQAVGASRLFFIPCSIANCPEVLNRKYDFAELTDLIDHFVKDGASLTDSKYFLVWDGGSERYCALSEKITAATLLVTCFQFKQLQLGRADASPEAWTQFLERHLSADEILESTSSASRYAEFISISMAKDWNR